MGKTGNNTKRQAKYKLHGQAQHGRQCQFYSLYLAQLDTDSVGDGPSERHADPEDSIARVECTKGVRVSQSCLYAYHRCERENPRHTAHYIKSSNGNGNQTNRNNADDSDAPEI